MNITIFGHVCVDNNISEQATYTSAGSPAMFMAKIYKKFPDVDCHIIAPYGSDFLTYIKDISIYPKNATGDKTLIYENISKGNIRSQKALNRNYARPLHITDELKKNIANADILFFAPLTPDYTVEYMKTVMQAARAETLKILIPQGYNRSFDSENNVLPREFIEADELLSLFDFVTVSIEENAYMQEIVKKWSQNIRVIMTLGDKGAQYTYKNEKVIVPVKPVKIEDIVDSVGSGDIFSASFGYKYKLTNNIDASLEFANDIARQCLFFKPDNLQFTLPE